MASLTPGKFPRDVNCEAKAVGIGVIDMIPQARIRGCSRLPRVPMRT
jgi:hypothetical protein